MIQEEIHDEWLVKSVRTRSARAVEHSAKAVGLLIRLHRAGHFDQVEKLSLITFTKALTAKGVKSSTGGGLVSMMVARMFIHLNMTWQGFVVWIEEDRAARAIRARDSYEYKETNVSKERSKQEQRKIDNHINKIRRDALDYHWSLTDGNGVRLSIKEYFFRIRRREPVRSDYIRPAVTEDAIRERITEFDFSSGGIADDFAAVMVLQRAALHAKIAALKAANLAIRNEITARRNKIASREPLLHRKGADPKRYRPRALLPKMVRPPSES